MESEFTKASEEKAQQTRFLRSQQAKKEAAAAVGSDTEDGNVELFFLLSTFPLWPAGTDFLRACMHSNYLCTKVEPFTSGMQT